jgi:hypothetical protein
LCETIKIKLKGKVTMSKERTLSYQASKQLSMEDLKDISAAGLSAHPSGGGGWDPSRGGAAHLDVEIDF